MYRVSLLYLVLYTESRATGLQQLWPVAGGLRLGHNGGGSLLFLLLCPPRRGPLRHQVVQVSAFGRNFTATSVVKLLKHLVMCASCRYTLFFVLYPVGVLVSADVAHAFLHMSVK